VAPSSAKVAKKVREMPVEYEGGKNDLLPSSMPSSGRDGVTDAYAHANLKNRASSNHGVAKHATRSPFLALVLLSHQFPRCSWSININELSVNGD
jgi:hypothetical protein